MKNVEFNPNYTRISTYRPFTTEYLYCDKFWVHSMYQQSKMYPNKDTKNKVIFTNGIGSGKDFSRLMLDKITNFHTLDTGVSFPLYYYEENTKLENLTFDGVVKEIGLTKKDGITDFILNLAKETYGRNNSITKEDIFYYVYGFLHNTEYLTKFSSDLKKMTPRIPLVRSFSDFKVYSQVGRELSELHLNYENVKPCNEVIVKGEEFKYFKVDKIKFASKDDKTKIIYNSKITIENIPLKAYEYVVNGKSAIEWILDRYQITTNKDSGIVNDPNDWGLENGNERYILDLLLSVIEVSVRTVELVEGLPTVSMS